MPSLERKKGGPDNWVEKAGGLPSYIERIAKHLHYEKGMSISRAIATAVNVVKKMCAGGDLNFPGKQNVNAKSRAQACKAVAEWTRKKARSRVTATEVRDRPLTDLEFAEMIERDGLKTIELASRAPGASGSNKPFDPSKYLRNAGNGQFAEKFTPTELIAGRRLVEGGITNLQVGQTFELPGRTGWVKRTPTGYFIQGPAGLVVNVKTLSDAVAAAANIIAGQLSRVGEVKK
jgi:hypothetical protein